jgi:hypothetical protein
MRFRQIRSAQATSPPRSRSRALNWTGNKARTQVARTLTRDTGVGYGVIRNALRTTPVSSAIFSYLQARTIMGLSIRAYANRRGVGHVAVLRANIGSANKRQSVA